MTRPHLPARLRGCLAGWLAGLCMGSHACYLAAHQHKAPPFAARALPLPLPALLPLCVQMRKLGNMRGGATSHLSVLAAYWADWLGSS